MMADSGRPTVLATLTPGQVPLLGPISPLRGLAAGASSALHLAVAHSDADVAVFAARLQAIRSSARFDVLFSQEFAMGFSLLAAEMQRIGGRL